jgi:hypothetical protein
VAILVGRPSATFGDVNTLISHIDEGYLRTASAQRELKQPTIEGKRFLYVRDLQGHVVDTDEPSLSLNSLTAAISLASDPVQKTGTEDKNAQRSPTVPPGRGTGPRFVKIVIELRKRFASESGG